MLLIQSTKRHLKGKSIQVLPNIVLSFNDECIAMVEDPSIYEALKARIEAKPNLGFVILEETVDEVLTPVLEEGEDIKIQEDTSEGSDDPMNTIKEFINTASFDALKGFANDSDFPKIEWEKLRSRKLKRYLISKLQ